MPLQSTANTSDFSFIGRSPHLSLDKVPPGAVPEKPHAWWRFAGRDIGRRRRLKGESNTDKIRFDRESSKQGYWRVEKAG